MKNQKKSQPNTTTKKNILILTIVAITFLCFNGTLHAQWITEAGTVGPDWFIDGNENNTRSTLWLNTSGTTWSLAGVANTLSLGKSSNYALVIEDDNDIKLNGDLEVSGPIKATGAISVDKPGGDLLQMTFGSGDYGGVGFAATGPYFRTPNAYSGEFYVVNGNNVNDKALVVGFDGSSKYMKIFANLRVGPNPGSVPNTVASFDGNIHINGSVNGHLIYHDATSTDGDEIMHFGNSVQTSKLTGLANDGHVISANGKAIFTSASIKNTSNWPDYVFEENYELTQIPELKQYIEENGHLPGVPSEEEVKDKGYYDQDQLNKILLEKVEELTLYIIELQSEVDQLKQ